ncbi:hypothetical protein MMC30_002413 [Trapelia coarctata]|nr:hypothetical protein [Trapelia coarctata]
MAPFVSAKDVIMTLSNPILSAMSSKAVHYRPLEDLTKTTLSIEQLFCLLLDTYIGRVNAKFKEQGVLAALTNVTSLIEYGTSGKGNMRSALRKLEADVQAASQTLKLSKIPLLALPYDSNLETSAIAQPSYVKKVLPLTIKGFTVHGRHDTGAEGNFISKELASRLGLRVLENVSECQAFSMGNGKLVRSVGKTRAMVTFANEPETRIKCWFNVLPRLTASLIMGSNFLKVTKTLSKYKHRLQACVPITGALPSVNLIGSTKLAKSRFFCHVDGRPTYVNADSASDLDLMSSTYVRAHRYRLDRRLQVCKYVQLADGTVAQTIGQVTAVVKLKDGYRHTRTFDVLPCLTSDVLFGDEFLDQIDAFGSYEDSFVDVLAGHRHLELKVLVSLGSVNGYLRRFSPWTAQSPVLSDTASTKSKRLDDQDWREMLRHDREEARISRELTGRARDLAQEAEANRIADYEQRRSKSRAGYTSPVAAGPPVLPMRSPHRPPATTYSGASSQLQ